MKPLKVFYHVRLSGGDPPIDYDHAMGIMFEQLSYLQSSGLLSVAPLTIGVNGGEHDFVAASTMAGMFWGGIELVRHPDDARGEMPTLNLLRDYVRRNNDHFVLYHHIKGALHKGNDMYVRWRNCMERSLVGGWQRCCEMLEAGYDSVGCHWMTPERYGQHLVSNAYWGGNFWWAKSNFLATLPPLSPTAKTRGDFYEAELWIGRGPRRPSVLDLHPVWPGLTCP